ncbi:MAG: Sua5/YciO/YrdC/YwlC family protein [Caldilineaceae bacterium]
MSTRSTFDTERVVVDPQRPDPAVMARAGAVIRRGGLVAFPTETVYGLGANALDAAAVAGIFRAKGRPAHDPIIVHVADAGALPALVTAVPEVARPG